MLTFAHLLHPVKFQNSSWKEERMPYIIVRETDTGVLVEGLGYTEWSEIAALSQVILVIFATYLYHFNSF